MLVEAVWEGRRAELLLPGRLGPWDGQPVGAGPGLGGELGQPAEALRQGRLGQRDRETAEEQARIAAQSGDEYSGLLADAARYAAKQDTRRAARACREAIALRPDRPSAYHNLGVVLSNSGHVVEAAQRFLEAKELLPVGSEDWAAATAAAFNKLTQPVCAEVAKPEWWNDKELKALSARVVRAAPDDVEASQMRALVLSGRCDTRDARPRSAADLIEAATHSERCVALCGAPALKAALAVDAAWCRSRADAM
eukprot:scaffold64948_cov69-Phaeocystis_antarctica.AAC.2